MPACDCCSKRKAADGSPVCGYCARRLARPRKRCRPTAAAPGSAEKVAELVRRYAAGQDLWHAADGVGAVLRPELPAAVGSVSRCRRRWRATVEVRCGPPAPPAPGRKRTGRPAVRLHLGGFATAAAAAAAVAAWAAAGLGPFGSRDEALEVVRVWRTERRGSA